MKYSEIVKPDQEFTRSVNIQFDMQSYKRMAQFIPNETTIGLLKDYFVDITSPNSHTHARILYGSYGTGKSHFLTVLSNLLEKSFSNSEAYFKFLNKVSKYDEFLAEKISEYTNIDKKGYLVVPVSSDREDFGRCITFSAFKTLEKVGLIDMVLNGETSGMYKRPLDVIKSWSEGDDSRDRYFQICKNHGIDPTILKKGLIEEDKEYFDCFKAIYKDVTFGVDYVYEPANFIESINNLNKSIYDCHKFKGIVFIFDEFGRYLEDNLKTIKVKQIQDFAEYCDHGGYDTHLILVSHREISQYTQNSASVLADEWKKVEGRFSSYSINDRKDQCLSLIDNVLIKDNENWHFFEKKYSEELDFIRKSIVDFNGFLISNDDNPVTSSFPLHPISLFVLDKLSKKVAQNERTFFTFLSAHEENTVCEFLDNNDTDSEFHFVGLDLIFDYFESSFKSSSSETCYNIYKKYRGGLSKLRGLKKDCEIETNVLKAISVIQMIEADDVITANDKFIYSVLDYSNSSIDNAIKTLLSNNIIKWTRVYKRYNFYEASTIDIDNLIKENQEVITQESVITYLNSDFINFVVYPYKYNSEYRIKRVFVPVFTSDEELLNGTFCRRIKSTYDGVIAFVLCNKDCDIDKLKTFSSNKKIIYIFNKDVSDLISEVKKYIAVCYLEAKSLDLQRQDPDAINEINFYKEEQFQLVNNITEDWRNLNSDRYIVHTYIESNKQSYKGFKALSELASSIMFQTYDKTLIVNNELLNKNSVTGAMTASKKKIIDKIIEDAPADKYYGFIELSPEYTAIRSVLTRNGYYPDGDIVLEDKISVIATEIRNVISGFIDDIRKTPQNFSELINVLVSEPYGLRKGYISLLFAYLIREQIPYLVVQFYGSDQIINADLFEKMINRPEDYTVWINTWTDEQASYIDTLEEIFGGYINGNVDKVNRLKTIYDAMCMHYKGISKYARQTSKVSPQAKLYRQIIERNSKDYSEFFFNFLTEIKDDYSSLSNIISGIKEELDNRALDDLKTNLCEHVSRVFNPDESICSSLINFYDFYCTQTTHSFDYYTNSFLQYCRNLAIDEVRTDIVIVHDLAKLVTGFDLEYWSDNMIDTFGSKLCEIRDNISNYSDGTNESSVNGSISLNVSTGDYAKTTTFTKKELSVNAQTAKNKINAVISNFGGAVSYEEKIQILIDILNEQMGKR